MRRCARVGVRGGWWRILGVSFFTLFFNAFFGVFFFIVFSVRFFVTFWEVSGGLLGVIFDHFSLLFSIKKVLHFLNDFSMIFGWILGVRIPQNEHLVQARRSFSQNRLF